jgi:hypothetical protein
MTIEITRQGLALLLLIAFHFFTLYGILFKVISIEAKLNDKI